METDERERFEVKMELRMNEHTNEPVAAGAGAPNAAAHVGVSSRASRINGDGVVLSVEILRGSANSLAPLCSVIKCCQTDCSIAPHNWTVAAAGPRPAQTPSSAQL